MYNGHYHPKYWERQAWANHVGTDQMPQNTVSDQDLQGLPLTLRKHTYSNILKILQPKKENFQIKKFDIFHFSAQNTDCVYSLELPRWGSSNEYPQSMFWAEIWKIWDLYPCKPQFYYIKMGLKGVKII